MKPFTHLTGTAAPLPIANIDTDQIIPKQFLKTVSREGLSKGLFFDFKTKPDGTPDPDFVLNKPAYAKASILIAKENFGCGSSREHAPWALTDYGFKAVISTSIADIFTSNALKNGLVPVVVDAETHARLLANPGARATIDVERCELSFGNEAPVRFQLEPFARRCLIEGVDPLGWLLDHVPNIEAFETRAA